MRPDPVTTLKQQLGELLAREQSSRRATDVCVLIGTDAARVSDLRRGRLGRFSLESLIRFVAGLGYDVNLSATRAPEAFGASSDENVTFEWRGTVAVAMIQ